MITRCNKCGTKFEISAQLVQSEDPTVRCGECSHVFDAHAQLVTGDSIRNYTDASAGKGASRRQAAPAQATTPFVAAVTKPHSAVVTNQFAHISDDDLENAATVVIDQAPSEHDLPAAGYRRSAANDRTNDGFYSPDLRVDPADNQYAGEKEGIAPGRADTKIDPSMDFGDPLDNARLEFERTLALEVYTAPDDIYSPVTSSSQSRVMADDLAGGRSNKEGQAQRIADEFYASGDWQSDTDLALSAISDPVAEPLVIRDYPLATDGLKQESSKSFDPLDATVDPDRHLSPEERGIQPDSFPTDFIDYSDSSTEANGKLEDHDSASELRSYVSSRGVTMVSVSETDQPAKTRRSVSMLKPLLVMCVLAAAVVYFARDTIATMNLPEPLLTSFCGVTGCELPLKKDVEQLELIRHQMFSHTTLDNVLVFTVDVINRAKFPQPYPALVVTMGNSSGESVAFRKFQPDEYLEEDPALTRLPAGKPVRIKFEIVDPGPEAMSSELSFE